MADITAYINKILTAVYGEEVRGSIAEALRRMNTESSNASSSASAAANDARQAANNAAAAKKAVDDGLTGAVLRAEEAATNAAMSSGSIALLTFRAEEAAESAAATLSLVNQAGDVVSGEIDKAKAEADKAASSASSAAADKTTVQGLRNEVVSINTANKDIQKNVEKMEDHVEFMWKDFKPESELFHHYLEQIKYVINYISDLEATINKIDIDGKLQTDLAEYIKTELGDFIDTEIIGTPMALYLKILQLEKRVEELESHHS